MDDLSEWERLLKQELQLRKAPADFSARMMARLPSLPRTKVPDTKYGRWWPALHWAAAAALFLILVSGGYWKHVQEERIAGERARSQLITALRITASTIHDVRHKVGERHKEER